MTTTQDNLSIQEKINLVSFPVKEYKANIGGVAFPDHKALCGVGEDGKRFPLAIVGAGYQVFKNEDFINEALTVLSLDDVIDCGTFNDSKVMFIIFKVGEIIINGEKEILTITLINSYDKSLKATLIFGSIRVICDNMYSMISLAGDNSPFCVKHTKHSNAKFQGLNEALKGVSKRADIYKENMELLASIGVNDGQMTDILAGLIAGKLSTQKVNAIEDIVRLSKHGKGNRGVSLHDLFNGITDYYSNVKAKSQDQRFYGTHASNSSKLTSDLISASKDIELLAKTLKTGKAKIAEYYK